MSSLVSFPGIGLELNVSRVAFTIGSLDIYWYGLVIGIGMLLALVFAFSKARSFGIDDDKMVDVILLTTFCAIICARVYYIAFAPFKYESIWDMINLRDGGIAIYGAVIGAFVFGYIFCKWRKIPPLPMFDLAAMGFLIGQGVGRWGNFFNQEAFGTNTTSIFGMYSEHTNAYLTSVRDVLLNDGITVDPLLPVHPTFLYESVWCLLGFLLLASYIKRRKFDGEIAIFYAIWYGVGRFFIEGLRTDSLMTGFLNLRTSQLVAALSVIGGLIVWYIMKKRNIGITPPLPLKKDIKTPETEQIQELAKATSDEVVVEAVEVTQTEENKNNQDTLHETTENPKAEDDKNGANN